MSERIPREVYEKAAELLEYDPDRGLFRWKVRRRGCRVGWFDPKPDYRGYKAITVGGVQVLAHRLAWAIYNNEVPHMIDHEDGNPSNNTLLNLRVCTHSENQYNTKGFSNNTSGHKGVYWDGKRSKWFAGIKACGKCIFLGRFSNLADAVRARLEAELKYHGEFASHLRSQQ